MKKLLLLALLLFPASAHAAIAYVQTVTATGDAGATATTGAFGSNTTVGNVIIVTLDDQFSTASFGYAHTCSDNKGNTFAPAFQKPGAVIGDNYAIGGSSEVWWAPITTGGASHTVSCSQSGGGNIAIRAMEFSGVDTTSPFDQSSAQQAGGASFTSGSTATIAQADELLIGFIGIAASTSSGTGGLWTDLGQVSSAGTSVQTSYQIVAVATTYAYTGTTDNGNARTVIVTFKQAAAAGGAVCKGALMGVGCEPSQPPLMSLRFRDEWRVQHPPAALFHRRQSLVGRAKTWAARQGGPQKPSQGVQHRGGILP